MDYRITVNGGYTSTQYNALRAKEQEISNMISSGIDLLHAFDLRKLPSVQVQVTQVVNHVHTNILPTLVEIKHNP